MFIVCGSVTRMQNLLKNPTSFVNWNLGAEAEFLSGVLRPQPDRPDAQFCH